MATQLQTVNKILRRLRETPVTSVASTSYAQLIALFVNEAKEIMEDSWFWTVNETAIDTSILADGTLTYDLTDTNDRSFLMRWHNEGIPMAFDTTASGESQLFDISLKERNRIRETWNGDPDASASPDAFSLTPDADGRGWTISLLYPSNTARTWRTYWYIPQTELAIDGTDDSTEIVLPQRPLYLMALMLAMNERGEEMGEPGQMIQKQAQDALAAAMELDMQTNKKSYENITNTEYLRNQMGGW